MYQRYWGFSSTPFASHGLRTFQSDVQKEAIARIEFLVGSHRRVGLLTGPDGVGKSAILEHVVAAHRRLGQPAALIDVLGLDGEEFLMTLCESLGITMDMPSGVRVWRALFDQFTTNQYQKQSTLIVVDDAHEADAEVLTIISRLAQWQPSITSRVTLVCGCDGASLVLLGRRLLELADLRMELTAWEVEDTAEFIRHELSAAGCNRVVFDHAAICTIHALNAGVARGICRLAELALIAGAGLQMERIDDEFVLAVFEEEACNDRLVV